MSPKDEDKVPKERASLRVQLQSKNLINGRVLRKREKKSSRRELTPEQRSMMSERMKEYLLEHKEAKDILKFVGKTVQETARAVILSSNGSLRKTRSNNWGENKFREQSTNRKSKTNKKPNKKKPSSTKKALKNKKAHEILRATSKRPIITRRYSMRVRRGGRRGRPSQR